MVKPNPNSTKNSTYPNSPSSSSSTSSSSCSDDDDDDYVDNSPPPTNRTDEGETILKTPEEVIAELTAGDEDDVHGGAQGGGSVAIAVAVGGSVAVAVGGGMNEVKKRKNAQVKNPPSGIPTCPECKREFATWKAAFGHMRKHPERRHRGFFPPPAFHSQPKTSQTTTNVDQGNIGGVDIRVQSLVQRIYFNFNQTTPQQQGEAGTSNAETEDDSRKTLNFDLNHPPPPEDDDDMV